MFVKQPLASCKSNLIFACTFAHLLQSSIDKKMVVVEYWQYLANLTQAITHKESNIFAIFIPDAKLEDFGNFLYVFIWALIRFLCNTNQLWVIISITIFFSYAGFICKTNKEKRSYLFWQVARLFVVQPHMSMNTSLALVLYELHKINPASVN